MAKVGQHWTGKKRPFRFTAKHETFCHGIVAGLTHKDAYIGAGYRAGTANGNGPDSLLKREAIQNRIAELQAMLRIRLNISMNSLVLEIEDARLLAIRLDKPEAMIAASLAKAKLLGLLTDKGSIDVNVISVPVNRPMAKLEYSVEEWIAEFSPKTINGNGHDD